MSDVFILMLHISSAIIWGTMAVFIGGFAFKSHRLMDSEIYQSCEKQMNICKMAAFLFAVLYWFSALGMDSKTCKKCLQVLSSTCHRLGITWIIVAFISIVFGVLFNIIRKDERINEIMNKMRKTSFLMGAVFMLAGFLLEVN